MFVYLFATSDLLSTICSVCLLAMSLVVIFGITPVHTQNRKKCSLVRINCKSQKVYIIYNLYFTKMFPTSKSLLGKYLYLKVFSLEAFVSFSVHLVDCLFVPSFLHISQNFYRVYFTAFENIKVL